MPVPTCVPSHVATTCDHTPILSNPGTDTRWTTSLAAKNAPNESSPSANSAAAAYQPPIGGPLSPLSKKQCAPPSNVTDVGSSHALTVTAGRFVSTAGVPIPTFGPLPGNSRPAPNFPDTHEIPWPKNIPVAVPTASLAVV